MVRAELLRKREHGEVWLDRRPPSFDPLSGTEGISHARAELPSTLVVRRHDTPFGLVLEPERQMPAWIASGRCPLHEASIASRRSIL